MTVTAQRTRTISAYVAEFLVYRRRDEQKLLQLSALTHDPSVMKSLSCFCLQR